MPESLDSSEMLARNSPDWLPAGWTQEVKVKNDQKIEYYANKETGQKFYSKDDLIRYVEMRNLSCSTPQQETEHDMTCSKNNPMPPETKTNETPEWLPHGWIMELKTQKSGRKYKCYIDPLTGFKCYSKPEVFKYLRVVLDSNCTPQQKKMSVDSVSNPNMDELSGAEASVTPEVPGDLKTLKGTICTPKQRQKEFNRRSEKEVVIERLTPDGLPPGWTKEIKIVKGNRIRKKPPNMGELTGGVTSLKLEEAQDLKTLSETTCTSKQKQKDLGKESVKEVVILTVAPDRLPPGWTKEIKFEKKGNRTRQDPYYTDPVSGYVFRSQKDVLRYLENGDFSCCAIKPKKRDEMGFLNGENKPSMGELTGGITSLKLEEAQDLKTLSATACTSKQNKKDLGKESVKEVVILTVTPDGLPPGWTKEIKFEKKGNRTRQDPYYTDPVSGYVFLSQKDAMRYLETGDFSCCAIKPKKRDELGFLNGETKLSISGLAGGNNSVTPEGSHDMKTLKKAISTSILKQEKRKQSDKEVVIVTVTPDGLPPGWTKEIKIEKTSNRIRKDPYYTDPVSRYVFRSQKDALRYVETGELTSCAIKPRKRDEVGFLNEETSLPSAAKMQNLGHHATRRQLFAGTEDSFTSSLETTEAEGPRKRRCPSLSADSIISSAPTAKTLERKHSVNDVIEECTETEMVQEGKLASKNNNEKMQINSSKSKKNKALSMPRRSSKRILGHEPEMAINLALNERVLRDAARKSRGSGTKTPPGTLDNVFDA